MAGRARPGRDRGVKAIDINRQVVIGRDRNRVEHALHAHLADLPHRINLRPGSARRVVVVAVAGRDIADAELRHAGDVRHLRGAAQRVAVAVTHAVALVDKVQVRIKVHDVDRALPVKGLDHRRVHRMVAAQHQRHGPSSQNFADRVFGVGMAFHHVGMHDVGIAHIDDAGLLTGQVHHIVFMVIRATVAERKQRGGLADCAWAEARARPPLRSHVVGHADDGDVGVNGIPVQADR